MAQKHQGKPNIHSNETDEDLFPLFKDNGDDELFRLLFSSLNLSDGNAKPGLAPAFNPPDVPPLLDPTNFNSKSCSTDKPSPLDARSENNTIGIGLESFSTLRTNEADLPSAREPSSLTLPLQKQGASLPAGCGNSHDSGPLGSEQLATVKENSTSPVTTPGMGLTHARKQSGSSESVRGNGSGSSLGIVRTTTGSNNHSQSDPSSPLALVRDTLLSMTDTRSSLSLHFQMKPRKGASGSEQTLSPILETSDGTGLSSDSLTSAPLDNTSTGGSLNSNTHALPHRHIRTQGDSGDAPVSLEEFTSAQRPAAEAILAYKREHPDTAIPTTYFTSALVEVKDGKGRCLVGPCALEWSTTLKRVDHLYEHVRDRHFGCKPHKCDVCTQRFSRENDLKRHQSVHVRDGQACPVCDKEYTRFDNLKRHVKDKHPDYNLQPSTSAGSRNFGRSPLALRLPAKSTL
ncbi:hypothetical protein FRC17_005318 [Serendipita sp. 399]|nr:hypothetical protein FRC17_005318 [Serendipita sp. 399]